MSERYRSGKLAVILHADIAGSTALVQQDERLAHERIQETFHRCGDIISQYHGRVRELRGDALLAEFERASDAVTAALALQTNQSKYNAQLNDDIQPTVRVGIAMGEVIIADNTVTGAGVVLAQRVEQLAKPGGVVIQGAAYETIPGRFPFAYSDLGEHEVKGFDKPVRAYSASLKSDTAIPEPEQVDHRFRNSVVALASVAIVAAVVALLWFKPWEPGEEPASVERMAFPLPDKPSIVVLPLDNMSDDASQDYFADGMTEDLITDLSKNPGLFVIARNSSFSYKGQQIKIHQVAEELGVRYVLEGSIRRAGDQVRINAQLIDATTGGHLWAERYDGSLEDIFALQDQVTQQIVAALKVSLTGEETAKQARHTTDNAEAHDAFLQGWAHYKLGTPEDLARAIPFFEKAVSLDNNYGLAHAALASIFWDAQINDWVFNLGMLSTEIEDRVYEHLEDGLKSPSPLAHGLQSQIYFSWAMYDKAVEEAEKAVALDSNDATAHAALANVLILVDRPVEGLTFIHDAMRLDPYYPPNYLTILGAAQFGMENYEEALSTFERAVKRNPKSELSLIYMASCYGHLGRMREAEDTIETTNELRAGLGLGALTLERVTRVSFTAFTGEIDFPSFGTKSAQARLRAGLSKIPALTWQYLVTYHIRSTAGETWAEINGATKIDLATAKSFYDRGVMFIVIDNGTELVWKNGRVPGAVNLSLYEGKRTGKRFRETTLGEVLKKTDEVVIYACTTENYCIPTWPIAKAVNWGYQNVYYFNGGIAAWKEAGYPIEMDN